MKYYSIAIDGPSGAGKSTLARRAAKELGFRYVDTGAIYRTISYYLFAGKIDSGDSAAVSGALEGARISLFYDGDGLQHMLLAGTDVTEKIRLPEISLYASAISAYPAVRTYLLEMQRELARQNSVVMDGRDIGTVVLPGADVKVYLTASPEARARRRCLELEQRGTPQAYDAVLREIEERDYRDTHRSAAPLRRAADAVVLDTTELDFEQSFQTLLKLIRGQIKG